MTLLNLYKQYRFVFTELVKRDFKKKYKRSFLGVLWSMLAPLFTLLVLNFVFGHFFGRTQEYYTIYLFSGWLIFQYYNEATNGAMNALMANANIFSKVKDTPPNQYSQPARCAAVHGWRLFFPDTHQWAAGQWHRKYQL